MNKKTISYSFLSILTSGALIGLLTVDRAQAQPKNPDQSHHTRTKAPAPQRGMMTSLDQHFIEMMIPHHQGAIEMADLAISSAKRPEVKKLAEAIKQDQTREMQQMQTWYKQWYGKAVPATPMAGMGMTGMNQGTGQTPNSGTMGTGQGMTNMGMRRDMMGMEMDLEALKNAPDFDREFIRQMIPHHQMAVMMAQMVSNSSTHPEISTLAESITKSQSAEIQQMRQWYQTWYQ